jgi:hypothetical protein
LLEIKDADEGTMGVDYVGQLTAWLRGVHLKNYSCEIWIPSDSVRCN